MSWRQATAAAAPRFGSKFLDPREFSKANQRQVPKFIWLLKAFVDENLTRNVKAANL
jgi:hypothetical protein